VTFSDGLTLMTLVEGEVTFESRRSNLTPPTDTASSWWRRPTGIGSCSGMSWTTRPT